MRKTMLVALASVFGICVLIVAANAATTWQGPPSNCTSPEGSTCNTDGVVWNRTTPAQDGDFNLTGSGILGTGLTIQTGDLNANSLIFLKQNGDLWLSDGKSLVVNKDGSQSFLKIGNYGATTPNSNIKVTVFGDLETATEEGEGYATKISTPTLCLNGDCQSAWPTSGGGGTVTGATANGGLVLTGTTLGLSTSCTNDQVLKWNGTAWACSSDSGSVTSITPGTGITTSPNPITGSGTVSLDTTYADGRFVNTSGDTMSGSLNIIGAPYPSLSVDNGMGVYGQVSINNSSMALYAVAPTAGFFAGTSKGVEAYAEPGGSAGYFANKPSGLAVTKSVELATKDNAVEAVLGNIKLNSGNSLCFDTDCKSSWSSVGLSGITVGSGMTGGGASGNVSIGLGATQLLPTSACTSNQVPKWNGTAWACGADAVGGMGDVTDVLATAPISVTNSGGPQPNVSLAQPSTSDPSDYLWVSYCTAMSGSNCISRGWQAKTWQSTSPAGAANQIQFNNGSSFGANANFQINNAGNYMQILNPAYLDFGTYTRQMINLWGSSYGIGVQSDNLYLRTGNSFSWFYGGTHNDAAQNPGTGGRRVMTLNPDGQLLLGHSPTISGTYPGIYFMSRTANSTKQWSFYGLDTYLGIGYYNGSGWNTPATISTAGVYTTSDKRLKKDIKPIENALNKLLKLKGYNYKWKNLDEHGNDKATSGGFMAQDVEKLFPNWVIKVEASGKDKDLLSGDEMKMVNVGQEFDAMVVESMRELKVQNDMLQAENDMLLHRIEALEAKVK